MDMQKINVEIDGIDREANVIDVINLDNREFVVYSVDNNNETSDVFYSEIVKDEEGYDKLVDIQDQRIKQEILGIVNRMFS